MQGETASIARFEFLRQGKVQDSGDLDPVDHRRVERASDPPDGRGRSGRLSPA